MIRQQFEEAGILFPIVEKPVYSETLATADFPERDYHDTGYKGIFKTNDDAPLYIGRRYKPVHNEQLIPLAEQLCSSGMEIHKIDNYKDRSFRIQFKSVAIRPKELLGMPIALKWDLFNSYDGSHALELRAGLLVLVCMNGATRYRPDTSFYAKHTGGLIEDLSKLHEKAEKFQHIIQTIDWFDYDYKFIEKELIENSKLSQRSQAHLGNHWYSENQRTPDSPKFAYFMAATYLTTHNGLPHSQKEILERDIDHWILN